MGYASKVAERSVASPPSHRVPRLDLLIPLMEDEDAEALLNDFLDPWVSTTQIFQDLNDEGWTVGRSAVTSYRKDFTAWVNAVAGEQA